METWDAITARRNVRHYSDRPIGDAELDRCDGSARLETPAREGAATAPRRDPRRRSVARWPPADRRRASSSRTPHREIRRSTAPAVMRRARPARSWRGRGRRDHRRHCPGPTQRADQLLRHYFDDRTNDDPRWTPILTLRASRMTVADSRRTPRTSAPTVHDGDADRQCLNETTRRCSGTSFGARRGPPRRFWASRSSSSTPSTTSPAGNPSIPTSS